MIIAKARLAISLLLIGIVLLGAVTSGSAIASEATREPVRLIFDTDIGNDVDDAIKHSSRSVREDYRYAKQHPLVEAYQLYRGLQNDQPTYDLTSVLYAVRPERGYFDLSPPGRISVEQDGTTAFRPEPQGPHRYLIVNAEQIARVREAQELLCSQPPMK